MSNDTEPDQGELDLIQQYSEEFDVLTQMRHEVGAEEYGDVAFLTAPLVRMAAEELADLSNYARYMYIKLRSLEDYLNASGSDMSASSFEKVWSTDPVPSGPPSFVQREEVQRFLSKES